MMQVNRQQLLASILGGLMHRYEARVADVQRVIDIMLAGQLIADRNDIENDHIAFRTLGVPHLGISSLEKIFVHCGYQKRDAYHFASKKLDAFWYAPPSDEMPRIFISELRVGDLSEIAQQTIRKYTEAIDADPVDSLNLDDAVAVDNFLHSPLWQLPTWKDYQTLQSESEYAAWVIYNRYYLNHFTISVHNLPAPYNTVERFNQLLEANNIRLNNAGGKIKTSPDGLLIQSSTVAQMVEADFRRDDGTIEHHAIPGSYVEFAERRLLPEFASMPENAANRSHRREGFEAGNADKIFESTFTQQTKRQE